nr:hypothetical protein [Tanacetum cinerariifolium]
MKDVFEELEAKVDQNVVDRKHDEIERKNLLIANDNLIVECLSKEVFYVATNSKLNVSRFTKMHVAHTIVEARCLELEAELSNLRDKIHNDNHNELVNRFSNLEALDSQITQLTEKVTVLQEQNDVFRAENGKIKQHYKELYDSIKITRAKHMEQLTILTIKNVNLKAQILNNVNSVIKDHVKPTVFAPGGRENQRGNSSGARVWRESFIWVDRGVGKTKGGTVVGQGFGGKVYLGGQGNNLGEWQLWSLKAATSVVSRQDAATFDQSWINILTMGFLLKTSTSVVSRQEAINFYQPTVYTYCTMDHDGIGEKMNYENLGLDNLQIGCNLLHEVPTLAYHSSWKRHHLRSY